MSIIFKKSFKAYELSGIIVPLWEGDGFMKNIPKNTKLKKKNYVFK